MIPASLSFVAQAAPGAPAPPGSSLSLLMPVLLIVMFYFMLIRPQRRQQKEHAARLAALKTGDEVIAAGGIHGLVTNVNDAERTVTLKIADGVKIKVEKVSVVSVTKKIDEPEVIKTEVVSS